MKQRNGLYVLVYNAKLQSNFNYEQNIISDLERRFLFWDGALETYRVVYKVFTIEIEIQLDLCIKWSIITQY